MTIKTYNVAKVDEMGVELICTHPYLNLRDARKIRISMQKTFRDNKYVVVNMNTFINPEVDPTQ